VGAEVHRNLLPSWFRDGPQTSQDIRREYIAIQTDVSEQVGEILPIETQEPIILMVSISHRNWLALSQIRDGPQISQGICGVYSSFSKHEEIGMTTNTRVVVNTCSQLLNLLKLPSLRSTSFFGTEAKNIRIYIEKQLRRTECLLRILLWQSTSLDRVHIIVVIICPPLLNDSQYTTSTS